jgi:hypothetical protein
MKYFIAIFWCCAFQTALAQNTSSILSDGNFAQNPTLWMQTMPTNFKVIHPSTSSCAHNGIGYAYVYPRLNVSGEVFKDIIIPANTTRIELHYFISINTTEGSVSTAYDKLKIGFWDYAVSNQHDYFLHSNTTGEAVTASQLSTSCAPYNAFTRVFTNGFLIGNAQSQTVRVWLESSNDESNPTVFRVDDITVVATYSNPCTFNFNQSVIDVGASAASSSVTMQTGANCSWNVSNNNPSFVTLNNSSGIGQQAINFSYTSNPTTSTREAIISGNGGTSCTIRQAGQQVTNYTVTVTPNPVIGGSATGGGTFQSGQTTNLSAQPNSGYTFTNWTTTNGSLLSNQNPYPLLVNGAYNVIANFTATQGCTYTLSSPPAPFAASGGTGTINITTSNNTCAWTATKNCSWVTFTSSTAGTGNGTLTYTVASYSGQATQTCAVAIGGQTYVITQNGANQNCPLVKPVIRLMAGCVLSVPSQTDATYQWKRLSTVVGTSSNLYEVTNSGLYLCTVSLPNIPNCSVPSEFFHLLYSNGSCVVNNSEIESLTQLNIYPNPNNGLFIVEFDLPEPKMTAIRVYNALGQCVYTAAAEKRGGHQTQSIDLNKGTSGLYWVEIQLDEQKMVKKVMIE